MQSSVPLMIGLRYIRAKRRNAFISFVSLFAFLGMSLGVFALIVVLSVMNGFDGELKQRILRVVPHAYLTRDKGLEDWASLIDEVRQVRGVTDAVEGAAPYLQAHALASYTDGVRGIELQGIDPILEPMVSVVDQHMLIGSLDLLISREYNIILGNLLARALGVTIGDKVHLTLPLVSVTPAGIMPRSKRFTVVGVFEAGAQVDQTLALIHFEDAQRLLRRKGEVDGLRLRFNDIYAAPQHLLKLETQLGEDYEGKDWSETQGSLFEAIKMEKTVVGFLLGIIIAVAAFNIVTSLIMMIAEKRSDIAVLRTMGLSAKGVVGIFVAQGLVIGVVGILIGTVLGVLTAMNLANIVSTVEMWVGAQVFDPSIYFVTSMPSQLQWSDVGVVSLGAFAISCLATCYPAYRASQIAPAEALRYNI